MRALSQKWVAAIPVGLLCLVLQADARGTLVRGLLLYDGQPVQQPVDLVVMVYPRERGGSWRTYQRFNPLTVEQGRFEIALDLCATDLSTGFLEYRLRPSGADRIFEVMKPRQPVVTGGSSGRVATLGPRRIWTLQVDSDGVQALAAEY